MIYSKTCLKWPLKKKTKTLAFKINYHLMQVKNIAECSKRAFCNTFDLHLSFKIFVLSIFEWPLKTSFTVFFLSPENLIYGPALENLVLMACSQKLLNTLADISNRARMSRYDWKKIVD